VSDGLQQVRDWLRTGPLQLSDKDLQNTLKDLQDSLAGGDGGTGVLSRATEVGTTVTHIVAGFFIVLFGTYFFLADGPLIWTWFVRLFPARGAAAGGLVGSGRLDLAHPVRAGHGAGRRHRRDRRHDHRRHPRRAAGLRDRRAGVHRCVRPDDRCLRVGHGGGAGRARRTGADHREC
jgi:hypothetical protein